MSDTKEKLMILLDSCSLKSESAKRLLNYDDNDLFEFISFGSSAKHTVAILDLEGDKDAKTIIVDKSADSFQGYKEDISFRYKVSDIKNISKSLDIKYDDLILVFILETFLRARNRQKIILVTERKKILSRLNWKKNGFLNIPAHTILNPDEASIFIDLHCKQQKKFLIAPNRYANSGFCWYLYSLKTKLTKYQDIWSIAVYGKEVIPEGKKIMEITASLADRIIDMLIAIDKIGINYYTDVNNDTQNTITYHFNYWATLFTGVLDALALISVYRYQIEINSPILIGLQKEEFKENLFAENQIFKHFLNKNLLIIGLMCNPRNLIIHRERLRGLRFRSLDENFDFNMLRIPKDFFDQIANLSREKGDSVGRWGHYECNDDYFLEPYRFVQNATAALIGFVDEYLELLSFDEYKDNHPALKKDIEGADSSGERKDFLQKLENFKNFNLGYQRRVVSLCS